MNTKDEKRNFAMHAPLSMYDLRLCCLLHRRTEGEGEPEHGNDEQDEQSTLPPRRGGRVEAWILCELDVLRDVLRAGGTPLLVVVVAREGLIWRRGHGGCEQRCGCDYISAPCFVMTGRAPLPVYVEVELKYVQPSFVLQVHSQGLGEVPSDCAAL